MIKGSGVDTDFFNYTVEPKAIPTVMLASRMLLDKGIVEFVEAARIVKSKGIRARFILVGDIDFENPMSIENSQLQRWVDEGIVEWWGKQEAMPRVLSQAHVVSLPSYAEGLPKVLIEALSCGRPIVTTNVSGCKETVRDGENGFLVPDNDPLNLSYKIEELMNSNEIVEKFSFNNKKEINKYSEENINVEMKNIFSDIMSNSL